MMFAILIAITCAFRNTLWRPYIYTTIMVFLGVFGFFNGYVTSRYLKFFGTTDLILSTTISALCLPLFVVGGLLLEMFFAHIGKQAERYSFMAVIFRTIGWYLLHSTMCYYGAFKGYLEKATPPVVAIGKVRRPIPD